MPITVGVLGAFSVSGSVSGEGGTVDLPGRRQRSLTAILALEGGRTVSAARLIDLLWPDTEPNDPLNALQHQISRLRAAIGRDAVARDETGYGLDVTPDRVDALRFERLATLGRDQLANGATAGARSSLHEALSLWRGPALLGFEGEDWATPESARLERLRLDALEDRIEADLDAGLHREVIAEIEQLTGEHPFRERLWAQLMLAQYRSGRQSDALLTYQVVRKLLAEEKGLDPGPELQRLEAAIISQLPSLEPGGTVAAATRVPLVGNLVAPLTRFIGRHDLLPDVRGAIREHRLVTLIGPGGTGKTRLATEVGLASAGEFRSGCWLVDLTPLSDPDEVPSAVSVVLETHPHGGRSSAASATERAIASLGDGHALLILDNCEHVLAGVRRFVQASLAACPRLHVIATSRQALGLRGETRRVVPPLGVPQDGPDDPREIVSSEAVRLFEDRARQVLPEFELTDATASDVACLCRHLDGLPLAIELAAARVGTLPIRRIVEGLDERFRLLVEPGGASRDRHASLRATLDWSCDQLADHERDLFERLSVFPGGSSLSAVEWVGAEAGIGPVETLDALQALVDRSLLVADTLAPDEARYAMLETLQTYGRARLAERGALGEAVGSHRRFFTGFAERGEKGILGPDHLAWQRMLVVEHPNLRRAFETALADEDAASALRIAAPLWQLWAITDRHHEGRRWLEEALQVGDSAPAEVRAHALTSLCYLAGQDRDIDRALAAGDSAIALAEDVGSAWEVASAKHAMALVLFDSGDVERAERYVDDARPVMEEAADDWRLCALELIASSSAVRSGDLGSAADAAGRVLARATRIGYLPFMCWARLQLGTVAQRAGRPSDARSDLEAALELALDLALPHYVSFVEALLAGVAVRTGDGAGARRWYADALETAEDAGAPWFAALARVGLAAVLEGEGEIADADALLADVVAWGDGRSGGPARESFFITLSGDPYAIALITLGARDLGSDEERGAGRLRRGIDEAVHEQDHAAIALALERSAARLVRRGHEEAVVLVAAATAIREANAYPRSPLEDRTVDEVLEAARATLTPEMLMAAQERGCAISLEDVPAFLRQRLG
jgi:predicted ATPase/DNA-binding SARP family transcriptional activator